MTKWVIAVCEISQEKTDETSKRGILAEVHFETEFEQLTLLTNTVVRIYIVQIPRVWNQSI